MLSYWHTSTSRQVLPKFTLSWHSFILSKSVHVHKVSKVQTHTQLQFSSGTVIYTAELAPRYNYTFLEEN